MKQLAVTPPPSNPGTPGYLETYLGMVISYQDLSTDTCKYIVHHGENTVRCPSLSSAHHYIEEVTAIDGDDLRDIMLDHAAVNLERAAHTILQISQRWPSRLPAAKANIIIDHINTITSWTRGQQPSAHE